MTLLIRKRKKPRIDMVPLIDVLMVLIIFFLVTMQFRDLRALNIRLPKIDTAGSNLVSNELIVSISSKGEYSVDNKKLSLKRLNELFVSLSSLSKKPIVLVNADEETPLKNVTEIIDLCRKSGLEDFRLQSR